MKKRILLLFLCLHGFWAPKSLQAKIYYINRGTKYHIGDNRYELSEDAQFLGAYSVVGQEWIQPFQMNVADKVKVHIEKIWGVDDCDYCKVMVSIDGHDMLRLSQANNGRPVDTLEILAPELMPGMTHYLKIASYGRGKVDDFMIQDVSVETQVAELKLLPGPVIKNPDVPMPVPTPTFVVPSTPCQSAHPKDGWLPGESQGKKSFELASKDRNAVDSGSLGALQPGEALEFYLQVTDLPATHEAVGHAVEFILDDGEKEGWVLSFREAQGAQLHGNMIRKGVYRAEAFKAGPYQASAWNKVRIQSCVDGQVHLLVNEREANKSIPTSMKGLPFTIRALGLKAVISMSPMTAPLGGDAGLPPPPGGL